MVASWLVPTTSTVASAASDSGTVESGASASWTPASAAPDSGTVESSGSASVAASAAPLLETPLLETPLLETPLLETPLPLPLLEAPLEPLPLPLLVPLAEPVSPVASSPPLTSVGLLPPQAATRLPASAPAKANRIQRLESTMRPLGGIRPSRTGSRQEPGDSHSNGAQRLHSRPVLATHATSGVILASEEVPAGHVLALESSTPDGSHGDLRDDANGVAAPSLRPESSNEQREICRQASR
jgi:hypothetical protein